MSNFVLYVDKDLRIQSTTLRRQGVGGSVTSRKSLVKREALKTISTGYMNVGESPLEPSTTKKPSPAATSIEKMVGTSPGENMPFQIPSVHAIPTAAEKPIVFVFPEIETSDSEVTSRPVITLTEPDGESSNGVGAVDSSITSETFQPPSPAQGIRA